MSTEVEFYRAMQSLMRHPEWKTFEERIRTCAEAHKESSVRYSSKANAPDAQRQAWIAEGLIEAIEEPESVVRSYEFSVKGIYEKACHLCGHIFDKVSI